MTEQPKPGKLRDRVRDMLRVWHYLINKTERETLSWISRSISRVLCDSKRWPHSGDVGVPTAGPANPHSLTVTSRGCWTVRSPGL
jgi:hypothetical protein